MIAILAAALVAATPATAAEIRTSPDGRTASTTLDVLTYNLEGVPRRKGRKAELREIGELLNALRKSGEGPDVILFQERFRKSARKAVAAAGYAAVVAGPSRTQRRTLPRWGERRGHKLRRGEWGLKLASSGLAIASAYPIEDPVSEPYSNRACAGLDCLSNKGALTASLRIPGVPEPLQVFNTHMNAQRASRVGQARFTAAHHAQVRELADFIAAEHNPQRPVILGGDFNMRHSEVRYELFKASQPFQLVHQACQVKGSGCKVEMSWDGDAPWLDTQDLQLFGDGAQVKVRPVRVRAIFDGRADSPRLSDHDGFLVTYELSWPAR